MESWRPSYIQDTAVRYNFWGACGSNRGNAGNLRDKFGIVYTTCKRRQNLTVLAILKGNHSLPVKWCKATHVDILKYQTTTNYLTSTLGNGLLPWKNVLHFSNGLIRSFISTITYRMFDFLIDLHV